jgi:predicted nucleotidyltransferase
MKKRRSRKEIEHLFPQVRDFVQDLFGDRLAEVVLYGSFAKDRANQDSDIDLAVVLKNDGEQRQELDRLNDFIADLGLESNELFSILTISLSDFQNSRLPIYRSLREEGVRL